MRRFGLLLCVSVCLGMGTAQAQQQYAAVLLEYLTGDADAAVVKVRGLDYTEILAGVDAFNTTHARQLLPGAAALHTEAAFRTPTGSPGSSLNMFHLQIATAIVEFGDGSKVKPNSPYALHPVAAAPVNDDFRRLWYCAVITVLLNSTRPAQTVPYLKRALGLFPSSVEIRLLAGIEEDMRTSPRMSGLSAGDRRDALKAAEANYRFVLQTQPDRAEARLRLGRVLQLRNELPQARALLAPLVAVPDNRIAYLSQLFLGGIEDATGHPDAALAAYDGATRRWADAQTARIAASELRHRKGEREAAAEDVREATGTADTFDPWWTYVFGEYWRAPLLLDALRKLRQG